MQVMIHCERCRAALNVPPTAAGRRAKCPACGTHFIVPSANELLEETISSWIEHDVDEVLEQHHQRIQQQLAQVLARSQQAEQAESRAVRGAFAEIPGMVPRGGRRPRGSSRREAEPPAEQMPEPPSEPPPDEPAPRTDQPARAPDPQPQPAPPDRAKAPEAPGAPPASPAASALTGEYPQALEPEAARPYLVVRKVNAAGVRLAFDARWLTEEGFRASMPVRCVFSSAMDRGHLIARPVVFADRARSEHAVPEQIADAAQNRVLGQKTTRQIARMMGRLAGLRPPFDLAMPYYVSNEQAQHHLHAETHERPDGGMTCEVLIPDVPCALAWLGRVNGVCGTEYELLEQESALLHGEVWQSLSNACRQRITVWCPLEPREQVHLYLSDAEFGRKDAGLSGLVLTERRLVFHKYHHSGSLPLPAENAVIHARSRDRLAQLTLLVGHERSRMICIHEHELGQLAEALKDHPGLTLQVSEG